MTAVDINGATLVDGDSVLVLYGTVAKIDTSTDNRAYLALPDGTTLYVDTKRLEKITTSISTEIAAAGPAASGAVGTATLDFGAFPGASDTSVAVVGQAAILATSVVQAWLRPDATADHTADEHRVETLRIEVGNIVAGVGFTIYGMNTSQLNEPVVGPRTASGVLLPKVAMPAGRKMNPAANVASAFGGGSGTRIYGKWSVQWRWS